MNKIHTVLSYLSVFMLALLFTGYSFSARGGGMYETRNSAMRTDNRNIISIDNFTFKPQTTTVGEGATVTWVNHDDIPHLVVIVGGKDSKSPALDTDDEYSYKFDAPGTYEYFCSLHPKMTGKIVVK